MPSPPSCRSHDNQARPRSPADLCRYHITDVIRQALADNFERIPFTNEGGFIATDLGEQEGDDFLTINICGFMGGTGQMFQQVTVIYFDTLEKANRFVNSTEGGLFDDPYGDGQDNFEYTTYAGDPKLPFLISPPS